MLRHAVPPGPCRHRARPSTALTLLGLLAACERLDDSAVLHVGFMPTQGGEFHASGAAVTAAAELAVRDVNASGLSSGDTVLQFRLIVRGVNTPEDAARAAHELVNQEQAAAIIGPSISTVALPAATIAEEAGIPFVTPGATHPAVTRNRDHVFAVAMNDRYQGQAMARFAIEHLTARRAAVLFDRTTGYSRGIANVFKSEFERLGGVVSAFEGYEVGPEDLDEFLRRIAATAPEVLYLPNFPDDVRQQAVRSRALGIDATLLGSGAWSLADLTEPVFDRAYHTSMWSRDVDAPLSRRFVERYRELTGTEPIAVAALTYDAVHLLAEAVRRAAGTSPQALRDGLAAIDVFEGVTGTISFDAEGNSIKPIAIVRVEEGAARIERWIDVDVDRAVPGHKP